MYLTDEEDDQMKLNAKDRDKKEREYFERKKKKQEEARKLSMERAQKQKAEREARERAAREQAAKEATRKKAAESQAAKTAKERDAEEKAYYESGGTTTPIKALHQAGKTGVAQSTNTDTGEYKAKNVPTASDYAKEIAWREKQDALVYEDFANRWKPGSGILGAGSKAYAENVEHEWKDFTSGQIPIPDLTFFDSVEAQKSSRDISATEVMLDMAIPGAIAGATLGLPFIGASIPVAIAGSALSSIGGSVVGSVIDPSLESSGPSETFRIIARDEDQKITTFYEATKYNQGGIDMITTIRADGVVDGIVTRDYYPYDSFKKE